MKPNILLLLLLLLLLLEGWCSLALPKQKTNKNKAKPKCTSKSKISSFEDCVLKDQKNKKKTNRQQRRTDLKSALSPACLQWRSTYPSLWGMQVTLYISLHCKETQICIRHQAGSRCDQVPSRLSRICYSTDAL